MSLTRRFARAKRVAHPGRHAMTSSPLDDEEIWTTQAGGTQGKRAAPTYNWGSCMSRDIFGFLPEQFPLTTYASRQSLVSAGNDSSAIRS